MQENGKGPKETQRAKCKAVSCEDRTMGQWQGQGTEAGTWLITLKGQQMLGQV